MRSCLFLLLLAAATQADAAQKIAFPYEATVEVDDPYVRSGPGKTNYYPTDKLRRGAKVIVQRHDPGDWHMIVPPEGSFSWVPAKSVDLTAGDRGRINHNDVVVSVGSFQSDIREYSQRTLHENDEVRILGEKMLRPRTGEGPDERWYKIAPPRGEWRWIEGKSLSPPPRDSDRNDDLEPFGTPPAAAKRGRAAATTLGFDDDDRLERPGQSSAKRDYLDNDDQLKRRLQSGDESGIADRPLVRRQGNPLPEKPAAPKGKRLEARLEELAGLDARFRSILEKDPLDWDVDLLERDYLHLRSEVDGTELTKSIDTRLTRMEGYRRTRAEHEERARLADETLRRDAELAEIQRRHEFRVASLRQPTFDGAGVIQRSALTRRGAPKYALVAPSGKVVAYLVAAPGVDLETWLGRSAGVTGNRTSNADLKADLITVTRLAPVRLAP